MRRIAPCFRANPHHHHHHHLRGGGVPCTRGEASRVPSVGPCRPSGVQMEWLLRGRRRSRRRRWLARGRA